MGLARTPWMWLDGVGLRRLRLVLAAVALLALCAPGAGAARAPHRSRSFQAGFHHGFQVGYPKGFNSGFNSGYTAGYQYETQQASWTGSQAQDGGRTRASSPQPAGGADAGPAPRSSQPSGGGSPSGHHDYQAGFRAGYRDGFNAGFNPGYRRGFPAGEKANVGAAVVKYAERFIGTPYQYGGNGPGTFDCSGFVVYVYAHFGYQLPRTSWDEMSAGRAVQGPLQLGDLVFWDGGGHVGIYTGNDSFISATVSRGIWIYSFSTWSATQSYTTARRILASSPTATDAGRGSGGSRNHGSHDGWRNGGPADARPTGFR